MCGEALTLPSVRCLQTGVLALPAGPRAVLTYARAMGARVHAVAVVPDPRTPDFRVFCAAIVQRCVLLERAGQGGWLLSHPLYNYLSVSPTQPRRGGGLRSSSSDRAEPACA